MMSIKKVSGPQTIINIIVLGLLSISTAFADNWYIQASKANLRAEPASHANIVAKLPIATIVKSVQSDEQWLQVTVHMDKPLTGWVHQSVLGKDKPTLAALIVKYEQTDANDLAGRLKWLERAAAIAPEYIPVLEDLARTLDALDQRDRAHLIRQEIEKLNMRGAARYEDSMYIQWLSYCNQEKDLNESTIIPVNKIDKNQQGNFCVTFEEQAFEPIMGGYDPIEEKVLTPWNPAIKLYVSVNPAEISDTKDLTLSITVNQKMPVCLECSSSCWKLKEWVEVSKSYTLGYSRLIIDIEDIIRSWDMMGIKVTATILKAGKVIDKSVIEKSEWAWCL